MYDVLSVLPTCAAGSMWLTVCDGMLETVCTPSPSRLTLAYSLPTAFPNKALNRLERLQTPKGVSK